MNKLSRLVLVSVLLWPLLGGLGLIILKEYNLSHGTVTRVAITGFDPRDLMHGHYLRFRFDGPGAPDAKPHDYYIPEASANRLDSLLRNHQHRLAVDVRRTDSGDMSFDGLYIDDLEWREYIRQNPNN